MNMELIFDLITRIANVSQFIAGLMVGCVLGWTTCMYSSISRRERAQQEAAQAATERERALKSKAEADEKEAAARIEEIRRKSAAADEQAKEWRKSLEASLRL